MYMHIHMYMYIYDSLFIGHYPRPWPLLFLMMENHSHFLWTLILLHFLTQNYLPPKILAFDFDAMTIHREYMKTIFWKGVMPLRIFPTSLLCCCCCCFCPTWKHSNCITGWITRFKMFFFLRITVNHTVDTDYPYITHKTYILTLQKPYKSKITGVTKLLFHLAIPFWRTPVRASDEGRQPVCNLSRSQEYNEGIFRNWTCSS